MVKELNLNLNPLVSLIVGLVSCGKNSVYKGLDIAYRLVQSAIHNQSLEAMFKLTGYLSADRMLDKLHSISVEQTKELIKKSTSKIKLPKRVTLAIDFTDKRYYGDKNHLDVIGSKGGKYVRKYIELSCVKPALFLNALPVNLFNNNKVNLIAHFIDEYYELYEKSKIQLLLVDREFFTKKVTWILIENKIPFIMPAVKNQAITKLVEQYKKGKLKQKIKYQFGEKYITLVFLTVKEEVYVFATNTNYSPLKISLLYTKRWQIETNFREQNNFIFKTKTIDFDIRYLAFVLGGLLFNTWQLTRKKVTYTLESYLFKQYLIEEILKIWQHIAHRRVVKIPDYFLVA